MVASSGGGVLKGCPTKPKIAIGEQIHPQQSHQIRQRPVKSELSCRKRSIRMAINAVHTWIFTALGEVPTKVLILRFCFKALKNSSICQRSCRSPQWWSRQTHGDWSERPGSLLCPDPTPPLASADRGISPGLFGSKRDEFILEDIAVLGHLASPR